jgi:hypothetical protein
MQSNKIMPKAVPLLTSMSTRSCAYPNVNANWLLKGEGEMFLDNSVVREPDMQKWSSTDLRKRIDRLEAYLKKRFDDFE